MPGETGYDGGDLLVCFLFFAREAAGATGARHSLRPQISGQMDEANPGAFALWERSGVSEGCVKLEQILHDHASSSPAKAGDPVFQKYRVLKGRSVLDTPLSRGMTNRESGFA